MVHVSIRNGWIGRQLPRLFKEQHLDVRSFDPVQVFVHYSLAELFLGSHLTRLQRQEPCLQPSHAVGGIICGGQTSVAP